MLAWMDREALARTVETGEAHYWSRSRKKLWRKGETSGHVLRVVEVRIDCDADAVLLRVESVKGIACHTGRRRCFFRRLDSRTGEKHWVETDPVLADPGELRRWLTAASSSGSRRRSPRGAAREPSSSYVASLNAEGARLRS